MNLTIKNKQARAFFLLISIFFVVFCNYLNGPVINNGDYIRVTRSMFFSPEISTPIEESYALEPFNIKNLLPGSSLAAVGALTYLAHKILNQDNYYTITIWIVLNLIFITGVYKVLFEINQPHKKTALAFFSFIYLVYSFYFKSLYDEAFILSISPWVYVGFYALYEREKKLLFVFFSSSVLIAKTQMIFLLPVFIWALIDSSNNNSKNNIKTISCVVWLIFVSMLSFVKASETMKLRDANFYNRFFNGIGWSLQHSSDWHANQFTERMTYFDLNQASLQKLSEQYEPLKDEKLFGTSYWPTASKFISDAWGRHGSLKMQDNYQTIVDCGSVINFLKFFASNPNLIFGYLENIYETTLFSNYCLQYIRTQSIHPNTITKKVSSIIDRFMNWLGVFFFMTGILFLFIKPTKRKAIVLLYFYLGAPLFSVVGDGYYEFEKHMAPFFIMITIPLFFFLYDNKFLDTHSHNL